MFQRVRPQGCKKSAPVLQALIEIRKDTENPGNLSFPGFLLRSHCHRRQCHPEEVREAPERLRSVPMENHTSGHCSPNLSGIPDKTGCQEKPVGSASCGRAVLCLDLILLTELPGTGAWHTGNDELFTAVKKCLFPYFLHTFRYCY